MKARSLFYFIAFFCFTFSSCKKEIIDPSSIEGKWYVERYTIYSTVGGYNSGYYDFEPKENYESVGVFDFESNGTGNYTFENIIYPFTYSISDIEQSAFSSDPKNVNSNAINLEFDKSKIISLNSPIISSYYTLDLTRYEIFTKTPGTLRFRANLYSGSYYNSYNSSYSDNVEFICTKQ